jgi:AsmA family protein
LVGRLGNSDFAGRIAVRNLNDKPDFDVRVDSQLLDLDPYVAKPPAPAPAVAPAAANARRGAKGLVIPATQLTLPTLKNFTGTLAVRARELHLYEQVFRDLNIQATLRQNRFALNPLEVSATDGQIKVQADLTAQGNSVLAHLSGTGKNLRIQFVPFAVGRPNATAYTADIDLRGSGATLRELAASLNGRIRFLGSGGRIASSGFLARSNDFLKQLLSAVNPIAVKQPTTEIVCTAFLLRAKDGVLTTDPAMVMRTGELDVISNGSLDLKTEKLDLNFKTAARKGVGIGIAQLVNPYIKVTGTLGEPGITLDPKGALVNGGAAAAQADREASR